MLGAHDSTITRKLPSNEKGAAIEATRALWNAALAVGANVSDDRSAFCGQAVAHSANTANDIRDECWAAFAADAAWLSEGRDEPLMTQPLWLVEVRGDPQYKVNFPLKLRHSLDAFSKFSEPERDWKAWLDWYRGILPNRPNRQATSKFGVDADLSLALASDAYWTGDPTEVVRRVAKATVSASLVAKWMDANPTGPSIPEVSVHVSVPLPDVGRPEPVTLPPEELANLRRGLAEGASNAKLFEAASFLRRDRPVVLFPDIVDCLQRVTQQANLADYRLRTVWTLTSALHRTLIDLVRDRVEPAPANREAQRALTVLEKLESHPLVQSDRPDAPDRGIRGPLRHAQTWLQKGFDAGVFPEISGSPVPAADPEHNVTTQLDAPTFEDELGRAPFAKLLVQTMERLRRANGGRNNFAVHLHAPWGAGKSSVLLMIERMLTVDRPGKTRWAVVNFNAWQHERRDPPWWAFVETVRSDCFKATRKSGRWLRYFRLMRFWVTWEMQARFLSILLAGAAGLLILGLIWTGGDQTAPSNVGSAQDGTGLYGLKSVLLAVTSRLTPFGGDYWKGIAAAFALLGAGVATFRSFMFGSEKNAKFYEELSLDPLGKVTGFFDKIVRITGMPVCVFIDDLDRCGADYVVHLLEGIQTAFRHENVTYVVAADRAWIKTSFESHYDIFSRAQGDERQPLGYMFLEKIFQVSTPLPGMSPDVRKAFWEELINRKHPPERRKRHRLGRLLTVGQTWLGAQWEKLIGRQFTTMVDTTVPDGVAASEASGTESSFLERVEAKGETIDANITRSEVDEQIRSNPDAELRMALALKLAGSAQEQQNTEHLLACYARLLPYNPRVMKRMINAYALRQSTSLMEGDAVPVEALARWTILEQRLPALADLLATNPEWAIVLAGKVSAQKLRTSPPGIRAFANDETVQRILGAGAEDSLRPEYVRSLTRGSRG
ncbi:KAP family P-loop NTPase fold protein [Maricaulis salignorans]|uniref:KAP family P-loop NTPase fold protein n=1 Tax=Maricaulis salignorans TaxID=144026 RepID=UPI003A8F12DD